jgi:hypothetical protein
VPCSRRASPGSWGRGWLEGTAGSWPSPPLAVSSLRSDPYTYITV